MTSKEKAKYLISMNSLAILSEIGNKLTRVEVKDIAKQCAIFSVDEIIKHTNYIDEWYWEEVKQELESL
jgi:predicted SPOUT superfamily RNA methylase MTH1